ncbi:MAG TPA: hypothetical protein VE954_22195 [Oligoflexus sp.]|uniref:hypothetical protein n=1 Tax=Oligoflexus sp. TaxID=1971216 RepID=UPI002D2FEABB|nr:hypothetical protein [Oligoflexus sp.]HYX35819.1 hypothetical protein [Oligoflexus sp.]
MATIENMIAAAVKYVNRLNQHYQIKEEEWPMMQKESPALWTAIEEIESMKHDTVEEAQKHCRRAIVNYERMFMRRASQRPRSPAPSGAWNERIDRQ